MISPIHGNRSPGRPSGARRPGPGASVSVEASGNAASVARQGIEPLLAEVRERIKAIPAEKGERRRAAVHLVVEAALVQHLGRNARGSAELARLVSEVTATIEVNAQLSVDLEVLRDGL